MIRNFFKDSSQNSSSNTYRYFSKNTYRYSFWTSDKDPSRISSEHYFKNSSRKLKLSMISTKDCSRKFFKKLPSIFKNFSMNLWAGFSPSKTFKNFFDSRINTSENRSRNSAFKFFHKSIQECFRKYPQEFQKYCFTIFYRLLQELLQGFFFS